MNAQIGEKREDHLREDHEKIMESFFTSFHVSELQSLVRARRRNAERYQQPDFVSLESDSVSLGSAPAAMSGEGNEGSSSRARWSKSTPDFLHAPPLPPLPPIPAPRRALPQVPQVSTPWIPQSDPPRAVMKGDALTSVELDNIQHVRHSFSRIERDIADALKWLDQNIDHPDRQARIIKLINYATQREGNLPPSLFIHGVCLENSDIPVAGGNFADVFSGIYHGQQVAVKRFRAFLSGDDKIKLYNNR
jgi:hypothetical protein